MNIDELTRAFNKYVPADSLQTCVNWILDYRIAIRITKSRSSKYGDYTPPSNGKGHRISINHDMNKYAFLLTFTHEVAHLVTWLRYKDRVDAHGLEWKWEFRRLMLPFLRRGVFPQDLLKQIDSYLKNPAATSCTNIELTRALRKYDKKGERWYRLEEIAPESRFRIRSGRTFIKGKLLKKNYCCLDTKTRQMYVINPLTEVQIVASVSAAKPLKKLAKASV